MAIVKKRFKSEDVVGERIERCGNEDSGLCDDDDDDDDGGWLLVVVVVVAVGIIATRLK